MNENPPISAVSLEPLVPVMNLIHNDNVLDSLTDSVKIIRDQIKAMIPLYDPKNYNEDNIRDAKADRANLNKFSKALNDKKISFRKEFMKPFEEFETVVKDAIGAIDETSGKIDKVIKEVEGRERLIRKAAIDGLWKATNFTLVPLCQVQKPEWLNKSTTAETIADGIAQVQKEINANIALLEGLVKPEDRPVVRLNYLDDLNLTRATTFAQKVKLQREERENKPIETAPIAPAPPLPPGYNTIPAPEVDFIISRTFKVTVPRSVMIKLGDFMTQNSIPFEVVAKG